MSLKGKTVLIIEDDPSCSEILEVILKSAGVNVYVTSNLEEASAGLFEAAPHFVLLDINLDNKNGLNFFVLIKKFQIDIPVFILSAQDEKNWGQKAKDLGAAGFISKPINAQIILEKLKKFFLTDVIQEYKFSDEQKEIVEVELMADISRVGETGCYLVSSINFPKNTKLKLLGEIYKDLGILKQPVDAITLQRSKNVGPKRQRTEVQFIGLTQHEEENIRKRVIKWK